MRRALSFLITRVLRSRAGAALVLTLLVLGTVATARALSDPNDLDLRYAPVPPLTADTPTVPDDGLLAPQVTASPTRLPDAEDPVTVAATFAGDWLNHAGVSAEEWHARLAVRATDKLTHRLSGVDPATVPADRLVGEPSVIAHAETVVEVLIPVDSGRLRLRLLVVGDSWRVDGVDWERT